MTGPPPPRTIEEFRDRLGRLGDLPRRMRQCADHLALSLDRIALSTVAKLALDADVPPSTMMRFCQFMGFAGFSDMQRLFRQALADGAPDYATRLNVLMQRGEGQPAALVAEFVEAGRKSLENLANTMDASALLRAVGILSAARIVHLLGLRRSFPVAAYLAHVFEKLGVPSVLHEGKGGLTQTTAICAGDAVLAISFAPYSDETLEILTLARARGLGIVLLTDSVASPLAQRAQAVLAVTEVDFGAFRSLSATLALSLGLAVSVAAAREN